MSQFQTVRMFSPEQLKLALEVPTDVVEIHQDMRGDWVIIIAEPSE